MTHDCPSSSIKQGDLPIPWFILHVQETLHSVRKLAQFTGQAELQKQAVHQLRSNLHFTNLQQYFIKQSALPHFLQRWRLLKRPSVRPNHNRWSLLLPRRANVCTVNSLARARRPIATTVSVRFTSNANMQSATHILLWSTTLSSSVEVKFVPACLVWHNEADGFW